jgi:hypothetical protein
VQSLACIDAWKVDPEIVNTRGGAIAIGHPLGASGGRILATLAKTLRVDGHRWGVAAICIGVGQGLAVVLENVSAATSDRGLRDDRRGRRRDRGRRDRARRGVRARGHALRAHRRPDPPGRDRPDRGVQQRGQRRHRPRGAAGRWQGPQGRVLVPTAVRLWVFDRLYREGRIELELVPQGNLAERMRAAGAGIGAFYCPTGVGTLLAEGKETRVIDGRAYVLEHPIRGDVALIKAHIADRMGNLVYRKTARNFGPVMATAATTTIVEVHDVVEPGGLDPEVVVTPGIFVDRVVVTGRRGGSGMSGAVIEHLDRGPLDRDELAARVARDIPDGSYVNLGIGQPTTVADHLSRESGIVLHTENGMLGMGPAATGDHIDLDLINAGKAPVTELPRRLVLPPRRLVRDDARRAPRRVRPRCLPGIRGCGIWPTGTPASPTRSRPWVGRWTLAIGAKQRLRDDGRSFRRDGSPKLVR